MKVLIFLLIMATGSMSFAQDSTSGQKSNSQTPVTRSLATTAEMVCILTSPNGDYSLEMLFDYDIDARTYTLTKVGAAGRGITADSPEYLWEIKSEIDLSRLAADITLSQPDGSYIEFSMLARHTGIVMRRGEDGFLQVQAIQYRGKIRGETISGNFTCGDTEKPNTLP